MEKQLSNHPRFEPFGGTKEFPWRAFRALNPQLQLRTREQALVEYAKRTNIVDVTPAMATALRRIGGTSKFDHIVFAQQVDADPSRTRRDLLADYLRLVDKYGEVVNPEVQRERSAPLVAWRNLRARLYRDVRFLPHASPTSADDCITDIFAVLSRPKNPVLDDLLSIREDREFALAAHELILNSTPDPCALGNLTARLHDDLSWFGDFTSGWLPRAWLTDSGISTVAADPGTRKTRDLARRLLMAELSVVALTSPEPMRLLGESSDVTKRYEHRGAAGFHLLGDERFVKALDWFKEFGGPRPIQAEPLDRSLAEHVPSGESPRVSIICSLYNGDAYIEAYLMNLANQTAIDDCELIIIDASSPGTESVTIERLSHLFRHLKYVRLDERVGIYQAWNEAIRMATGDFITNANLDDSRAADCIARQRDFLLGNPDVDVVYTDTYWSFRSHMPWPEVVRTGVPTNLPPLTTHNLLQWNSPHCAPMWRATLHKEVGYFDTAFVSAADWEFWLRCANAGKSFHKLDEPLVAYYHNPNGISTSANTPGIREQWPIRRRYRDLLVDPPRGLDPFRIPTAAGLAQADAQPASSSYDSYRPSSRALGRQKPSRNQDPSACRILICFGIPKSGSSFLSQIVDGIVDHEVQRHGLTKYQADEFLDGVVNGDFIDLTDDGDRADRLARITMRLQNALREAGGGVIVVKTHLPYSVDLQPGFDSGLLAAFGTYRKPAEMVLSRLDMVARLGEPYDEDSVINHYEKEGWPEFRTWLDRADAHTFYFDDLVTDPYRIAKELAAVIGSDADTEAVVDELVGDKKSIPQFNKGVLGRADLELTPERITQINRRFPGLMDLIARTRTAPPTVALVTPTLNSVEHIDKCIMNAISQTGDFNLRYHVQDGGSTDGTADKLALWKELLTPGGPLNKEGRIEFSFATQPCDSSSQALNRGFTDVDGDIYGWLCADDELTRGSIQAAVAFFNIHPDQDWLTGRPCIVGRHGAARELFRDDAIDAYCFAQATILNGYADGDRHPRLQQVGTYWTDRLWTAVGRQMREDFHQAADFDLWTRMARFSPVVVSPIALGLVRESPGDDSRTARRYEQEIARRKVELDHELRQLEVDDPNWMGTISHDCLTAKPGTVEDRAFWEIEATPDVPIALTAISAKSLEGPFPELGLSAPVLWLSGPNDRITIPANRQPSTLLVDLANLQSEQEVIVRIGNYSECVSLQVSANFGDTQTLYITANRSQSDQDVELEFSKFDASPRQLAALLVRARVRSTETDESQETRVWVG